ncbi:histidine kinase dimerization/phosphoacceptor domain -containing protein [Polymorphobacter sp.]|uniref:histidine kinase dimerization/phosphoacceptor domain -containing protein n=1 Tax=Polymorphobacter sp. TaxID=1909290 RepID=UPI003F6E7DF4
MSVSALDAAAVLEGLAEVALLVDEAGTIVHGNRAGLLLLGEGVVGQPILSIEAQSPQRLAQFVQRCRGSRQPIVGTIGLSAAHGGKCPCRGSVVGYGADRLVLLRLNRADEAKFALLARKLAELTAEVRAHQRTGAILRETVSERELLLRELQHRVSNNMQMLSGILYGAEREASSDEAKMALREAATRFGAISAVQQLLYQSNHLDSVSAPAFVEALGRAVTGMGPDVIELQVEADPVQLPIGVAPSLALILNELLTNAVKYGHPATGMQQISASLKAEAGALMLVVADNGPGFSSDLGQRRASGLGLVRGLLRQLGGTLSIHYDAGARCVVRVPDSR